LKLTKQVLLFTLQLQNMGNLDYVKEQRGLNFVKIGMKVEFSYGGTRKIGKIISGNSRGNLDILFDGEKETENCHPTWAMKYFDEHGKVLAEFGE
jgi:hypothetical protein